MSADPPAVVIVDTNVWISAFLLPESTPGQAVKRAVSTAVVVFSEPTFLELESRLWKPKFDRYISIEQRKQLLHDVAALAHWIDLEGDDGLAAPSVECRDPADQPFLLTAQKASRLWAQDVILISGDQDLLILRQVPGARICTPATYLRQ